MSNNDKEDRKKVQNMKTIAIIGGGISGTVLSLKLSKENFKIILFEKQNFIGGLSSSLQIKNYSLDFGPHIISLPSNSKIFYDIKDLMNENIILLSNLSKFSKIFYQNKIWDSFPNLSNVIFNSVLKAQDWKPESSKQMDSFTERGKEISQLKKILSNTLTEENLDELYAKAREMYSIVPKPKGN